MSVCEEADELCEAAAGLDEADELKEAAGIDEEVEQLQEEELAEFCKEPAELREEFTELHDEAAERHEKSVELRGEAIDLKRPTPPPALSASSRACAHEGDGLEGPVILMDRDSVDVYAGGCSYWGGRSASPSPTNECRGDSSGVS